MCADLVEDGEMSDTVVDSEPIIGKHAGKKGKRATGATSALGHKKRGSRKKGRKASRKRGSLRFHKQQTAAFFRFTRALRLRHRNWDSAKLAMFSAKAWCNMSVPERTKYVVKRKRRAGKKGKRGRSSSRKRKGRGGAKGRRGRSHKSKARRGVKCD